MWLALRELKGLSQAALAAKAGVNQSYYSQIERGAAIPAARTAARLLAALGVADMLPELAERLSTPIRPDSVADRWHRVAQTLRATLPGWSADGLMGPVLGVPEVPLSPAAQAGVVGIMELVGSVTFTEDDALSSQWMQVQGTLLRRRQQQIEAETRHALSGILAQRRQDPAWDTIWRLWPSLSESQRSILVAVAEEFLGRPSSP